MTSTNLYRLQREVRDFIGSVDWISPFAATLTLKQACYVTSDSGFEVRVPLTPDRASRNFRHFINLLSARVFGPSWKRFDRRVRAVPILEGGRDQRVHYHAVIDCPRADLLDEFPAMIADSWRRTDWGYDQVHVEADADDGWMRYMTKFWSKPDYASSIDWMNFAT